MAQEPVINVWPGSSTFAAGKTPFGYYDSDATFAAEIDKVASWIALRLGFPTTDVELIEDHLYAAFEEAIMEYGNYVHTYAARDLIMDVKGSPVAALNFAGNYIKPSLNGVFKLAEQYGVAAPGGGSQIWYQGQLNVVADRQVYDLSNATDTTLEQGDPTMDNFTIRKVFHNPTPAATRYLGGNGTLGGNQQLINEFGFDAVTTDYLLTPLNHDVMRMQAIELNDQIRKSQYGFKLTGDRIRIFPIPKSDGVIYFDYTLDDQTLLNSDQSDGDLISDISNIPYGNINYSAINSIAKGWIKRYALALSKEMLGWIRSKYSTIPIPDSEITLNGDELLSQAQDDQKELIEELKEFLDSFGSKSQMERKAAEAEYLEQQLLGVPLKFYVR